MGSPLERLYPYAPVWAQNVGISLYGLKYRWERLGDDFDQQVEGFRLRESWSKDRLASYVAAQLEATLLRAFDQVPYYRKCWQREGITRMELARLKPETMARLPIVRKTDLRLDPESFVAEDTRTSKRLLRYYSSGSTGTPLTAIYTTSAHRRFIAAREVRSFGWAGASIKNPRSMLGGRMVIARGDEPPPYYRYNWAERQVYFSAYHISPHTVSNYVEGFNRYRPRLLTGYAYSHYSLARMMLEKGETLDYEPTAAVLSSEKLSHTMKKTIAAAFRTRAYEEYGAVENCVLATECELGSLHVNLDYGIIEIVDERGEPVPPGIEGRVLCTGFLNDAQFFVRYEIGDCAIWSTESCGCGRNQFPVLKEIVGRLEDAVVGPDGREMVRFHGIFIDLPHVIEGQVIQEELDLLRVRVVVTDGFGTADESTIRSRFVDRLGRIRVIVERVGEIERTERGKFRAVISRFATKSSVLPSDRS